MPSTPRRRLSNSLTSTRLFVILPVWKNRHIYGFSAPGRWKCFRLRASYAEHSLYGYVRSGSVLHFQILECLEYRDVAFFWIEVDFLTKGTAKVFIRDLLVDSRVTASTVLEGNSEHQPESCSFVSWLGIAER